MFDGARSVFTSSGVASAKQTGHCGLTATVCSGSGLSLFTSSCLQMPCLLEKLSLLLLNPAKPQRSDKDAPVVILTPALIC